MINLSDVAATSLTTLYCRALESQSATAILDDPMAVSLTQKLTPQLKKSTSRHHQQLANNRVDRYLSTYVALRARQFDRYAAEFARRFPDAVIVNLGCGFDTRFFRIDNGQLNLIDLDLPEVIGIKRQLLPSSERYHFIATSVADTDWLQQLSDKANPILFLAEGLLMYLPLNVVKSLVLSLQSTHPGAELVAEFCNTRWLNPMLKWSIDWQLQYRHLFGADATFRSGISDSRDLERWHSGIQFLDEWSALDETEPKLGFARWLGFSDLFRKALWVVHYRLN